MRIGSLLLSTCLFVVGCGGPMTADDGGGGSVTGGGGGFVTGGGGGSITGGGGGSVTGGGGGSVTGGGGGSVTGGGGGSVTGGGGGSVTGGGGGSVTGGGGGSVTGGGGGSVTGGGGHAYEVLWDGGASADAGNYGSFSVPRGENGQRFSGWCAPNLSARTLWGTDLYTDDSDLCTAGAHMGLITLDAGGSLNIEVRPGSIHYFGTQRHGIGSNEYGSFPGSVAFVGANDALLGEVSGDAGVPAADAGQPDAGSSWDGGASIDLGSISWSGNAVTYRGQNGQRYLATCPSGGASGPVWGTGLYTDDSSICRAAVHAGRFNFDGGVVTIEIYPGASLYMGSVANGITSNDYGPWGGSYWVIP